MYPAHYAVPEGLNIKCIGYVRWAETPEGHNILTVWGDPEGNYYYCDDLWTPFSMPFWLSTRMSDLVQCTTEEFGQHVNAIWRTRRVRGQTVEENHSLWYRLRELMLVWGWDRGTEIVFQWRRTGPE